jgi:hypothetical protein
LKLRWSIGMGAVLLGLHDAIGVIVWRWRRSLFAQAVGAFGIGGLCVIEQGWR